MKHTGTMSGALLVSFLMFAPASAADDHVLAEKAEAVLKTHCYRCHGQDGSIEGGFNYVLDRDRLLARGKIIPGKALESSIYKRMAAEKMPPPSEKNRPSSDELALVKQWIDAGAKSAHPERPDRTVRSESAVFALIRDDLDKLDRRSRRFARYFSLHPQFNQGLSNEELQTYRRGLNKLLNSLSWHPRLTPAEPIDTDGMVLRIDLREFMWDANLWNRLVAEYPYAVFHDSAPARACMVHTASRVPVVRVDWFLATASRAPLYYELLQLPSNSPELERQLRVDVATNIQQERVARAGFNGSGISKNNRVLERHDSVHGAYWRTYDFDAIAQNLTERDLLLPDRRNIFAYPLGPGGTETTFQHAGGEVIFSLPNGLHAYMLVNADNNRIDKGPIAIVSDPKRPDRAVEAGVSCMSCHITGILPKTDQIRTHVEKNPKTFGKDQRELIKALYVEEKKMKALMDDDADRYRKALEKTGNKISATEVVSTMTLRYEADADLTTVASEFGMTPADFSAKVLPLPAVSRNLGSLRSQGGTVSRTVVIQAFPDVVRALSLGTPIQPGSSGQPLPDNTGEVDPLEAQSSPANHVAFSADGKFALIASADKSVRLWDINAARDLRRFIGHRASVWAVAFSPDSRRAASGGVDSAIRLWDVSNGNELRKLEGHEGLVTTVIFSPDGKQLLSAGLDHVVILWDLESGKSVRKFEEVGSYINHLSFAPEKSQALLCSDHTVRLLDLGTGKIVRDFEGHTGAVTAAIFNGDASRIMTASDDRTVRLWDAGSGKVLRSFVGHDGYVKSLSLSPDGTQLATSSTDRTVRLWDVESGKELKKFARHEDSLVAVAFRPDGKATLSASRDADVRVWPLVKPSTTPMTTTPTVENPPRETPRTQLKAQSSVAVSGTIAHLTLSPDGKWLYWLNTDDNTLHRLDIATMRESDAVPLTGGVEVLTASPGLKWLVAVGTTKDETLIQVVDPSKWQITKSFRIPIIAYDATLDDRGRLYLTGGKGNWTDVTVVDITKQSIVGRWGGVWTRSFVRLSADQKQLYLSTQGVSPGTLDALTIPEKLDIKPTLSRSPATGKAPLGGEFLATSDGEYLLFKNGTILRTTSGESEMTPDGTISNFSNATLDATRGLLWTTTDDGLLREYSYPRFKLQATYRLSGVGYQAVSGQGKLYLAVFDPKSLTTRPRPKNSTEIQVLDLKEISATR